MFCTKSLSRGQFFIKFLKTVHSIVLENNATINAKNDLGSTPLHWAIGEGDIAIVRLLLENNAAIDAKNNNDWTPLHVAAMNGHVDIARLLLEKNAPTDAKNNDGWTPLHWAAIKGNVDLVRLLLEKNAPIDAQNNHGWTPLRLAQMHVDVVELLVENGANMHLKPKSADELIEDMRQRVITAMQECLNQET